MKHRLEPKIPITVTFDFDPFKLNEQYFAYYPRYCSEMFTHDVNNIVFLFNYRVLNTFNKIKLFVVFC